MNFKSVEQVLKDEQASGHDLPLGSALNLLTENEQDSGLGLYLLRHPEHGTLLLEVGIADPEFTVREATIMAGEPLLAGTWEQVRAELAHCTVAVAE